MSRTEHKPHLVAHLINVFKGCDNVLNGRALNGDLKLDTMLPLETLGECYYVLWLLIWISNGLTEARFHAVP